MILRFNRVEPVGFGQLSDEILEATGVWMGRWVHADGVLSGTVAPRCDDMVTGGIGQVVDAHVLDPHYGYRSDLGVPEDIPIREKDTGNVYYVRVEGGALKLYDVDDVKVKSWWEVWK